MANITEVDFSNAKDSSEVFKEFTPKSIDFEQTWRIHLLDMIAPYCEHDKHPGMRSDMGQQASALWHQIMKECAQWEVEQGI